jgi:O-antigen biosynthesis protein
LTELLAVFKKYPLTGITGPMSNWAAPPQKVTQITYNPESNDEIDQYAVHWANFHIGQSKTVARLLGFCMLVRRDVVKRIGAFDERFGLGNYEDDDYCLRARLAGFECRLAEDVFIHHTGGQDFQIYWH